MVWYEEPCYFFISYGVNAAAYYAKKMELWSVISKEGMKLQQEMFSLLRKVDVKYLRYRKDLSYISGE